MRKINKYVYYFTGSDAITSPPSPSAPYDPFTWDTNCSWETPEPIIKLYIWKEEISLGNRIDNCCKMEYIQKKKIYNNNRLYMMYKERKGGTETEGDK